MRVKKYTVQLSDRPTVPLDLKARMVKSEAVEALLYGSVTHGPYAKSTTKSSAPYTTGFCYVSSGSKVDRGNTLSSRTVKPYMRLTARALKRPDSRFNALAVSRL